MLNDELSTLINDATIFLFMLQNAVGTGIIYLSRRKWIDLVHVRQTATADQGTLEYFTAQLPVCLFAIKLLPIFLPCPIFNHHQLSEEVVVAAA